VQRVAAAEAALNVCETFPAAAVLLRQAARLSGNAGLRAEMDDPACRHLVEKSPSSVIAAFLVLLGYVSSPNSTLLGVLRFFLWLGLKGLNFDITQFVPTR
jgi:hypothetical protein